MICSDNVWEAVKLALDELERAETKFPLWPTDPVHAAAIVQEELGELQRAVLQGCYQREELKIIDDDIRKEAIQTAAMALRFLANYQQYAFNPSKQI